MTDDFTQLTNQVSEESFGKITKGLLDDALENGEWDSPALLYAITGDYDFPVFEIALGGVGMPHPVDMMRQAFVDGIRWTEHTLGLALMTEAWRHRLYEELPEAMRAEMAAKATELGLTEDEMRQTYARVVNQFMPSSVPAESRREVRSVVVYLRNEMTGSGGHTRDEDDFQYWAKRPGDEHYEEAMQGRVINAMKDWLEGNFPLAAEILQGGQN